MEIYHEKQSKQLCALHALNNVFQCQMFTKTDLDIICQKLSPNSRFINPHKSSLGLGNYDINVIISALHIKHHELLWFDKRKEPNILQLKNIKGFILNIPNPDCRQKWSARSLFSLPTSLLSSRKHWIAITAIEHSYYNLDSKLDSPKLIGNENALIEFLRQKNSTNDTEIFLVVSEQIADSGQWLVID